MNAEQLPTPYQTLRAVNVNEHVEKKNNLSYLSWAWAVDQLLIRDHEASWSYATPTMYGDTMMVSCTVTAFGIQRTMQLPVMDYKNRAIANPDAFAVNTAMQRCLVKAIALHGLGLYIYAGEDLPDGEEAEKKEKERPNTATQVAVDAFEALPADEQKFLMDHVTVILDKAASKDDDLYHYIESQHFDTEEKLALWSRLPSNVRSAIKKQQPQQSMGAQA